MTKGIIYLSSVGLSLTFYHESFLSSYWLIFNSTFESIGHNGYWLLNQPAWICVVQGQCEPRCSVKRTAIWTLQTMGPAGPAPQGYHLALSPKQTTQTIAKSQLNSISTNNLSEYRQAKPTPGSRVLTFMTPARGCSTSLVNNVQEQARGIFLIRDNGT